MNLLSQCSQRKGFSPVWTCWCLLRLRARLKLLSHSLHRKAFSPAWIAPLVSEAQSSPSSATSVSDSSSTSTSEQREEMSSSSSSLSSSLFTTTNVNVDPSGSSGICMSISSCSSLICGGSGSSWSRLGGLLSCSPASSCSTMCRISRSRTIT